MRFTNLLRRKDPAQGPPALGGEAPGDLPSKRAFAAERRWWRRWLENCSASLRQWRFPRQFRIDAPRDVSRWTYLREKPSGNAPAPEAPAEAEAQVAAASPPETSAPAREMRAEPPAASGGPQAAFSLPLLIEAGVNLWRARRRMLEGNGRQVRDGMQRSFDELTAVLDALGEAGLEIRDHTGQAVPEGGVLGLKAICFEPTQGLTRHTVVETIKPSIYFQGRLIQMGEVIVGIPISQQE